MPFQVSLIYKSFIMQNESECIYILNILMPEKNNEDGRTIKHCTFGNSFH